MLELPFTLLLAGMVVHSRLHAREWLAIAEMSGGRADMLYALQPSGGDPTVRPLADGRLVVRSAWLSSACLLCWVTVPTVYVALPILDWPPVLVSDSSLLLSPALERPTVRFIQVSL